MALIKDETVSSGAKLTFGVVANLCNQRGYCFATNGYIAGVLGVHEVTISRYIAELINSDWLVAFDHITDSGSQRRLLLSENAKPPKQNGLPPLTKTLRPPKQECLDPLNKNAKQNKQILNNKDNIGFANTFDLNSNPKGRFIIIKDSTKTALKIHQQSFEEYLMGTFGAAYEGQKISIRAAPPIEKFFELRNGDHFNSNQHVWSSFKKLWLTQSSTNGRINPKIH